MLQEADDIAQIILRTKSLLLSVIVYYLRDEGNPLAYFVN